MLSALPKYALNEGAEIVKTGNLFNIKKMFIIMFGSVILSSGFTGCANTKLYSIDMRYDAADALIPQYLKADDKMQDAIITVSEFTDSRKVDDRMVIGRVVEKDGVKIMVLPKYTKPMRAVAAGIKEYLIKAGYKVDGKIGEWDLKEDSIPKVNGKIIIGGNIEDLDFICRKGFPTDTYKANIKLTIVFADAVKKQIFYKSTVSSNSQLEHVSFSEERMADQVNVVLGAAIEKAFEDRAVAQKIKETIVKLQF
jgi:hypothetical protein